MSHIGSKRLSDMVKKYIHHPAVIVTAVAVASLLLVATTKLEKKVVIDDDGKKIAVSTYKSTVKSLLTSKDISIGVKDKVLPGLNEKVSSEMTVTIKRAVPVNLKVDGKELVIETAENNLSDMLKAEDIALNELDKISPIIESPITSGMNISIVRVVEQVVATKESIAYKTVNKPDSNMEAGITKIVQGGSEGEKEVYTKVVYEDGIEVSRQKINEKIIKQPTDKIVAVGILKYLVASRGGSTQKVYYTNQLRMYATWYTNSYQCTGKNPGDYGFGITATGTRTKRNKNGWSTVAVDPRVIPLGTKLYIEGYGFAIAEDTGVRGNVIDLFIEPGSSEYWRTRYTKVYILK